MTGGALLLQKWSKGKMKEKVNNQVLFDKVSPAAACLCLDAAVYSTCAVEVGLCP